MSVSQFKILLKGLISFSVISLAFGSLGNTFPSYKLCVERCRDENCDSVGVAYREPGKVPLFIRFLWRCNDDCHYHCMWETVAAFERKGWQSPQFHGKWPFVRVFGIQEPASTLFSLMNLAVHVKMYKKFINEVPPSSPMYFIWTLFAVVSMNAWVWSAVFHTRDLPFTETMDYLSAFGMVFYFLFGLGRRLLLKTRKAYGVIYSLICLVFFLNHAIYLTWDSFDYRYNMVANITAGALSGLVSVLWCAFNWRRVHHSRYLAISVFMCTFTTILELSDFPPIMWALDAHALWHLSTVPIPYFIWKFVIEDCKYLRKNMYKW